MPNNPTSNDAAQSVARAHLFAPYLARFCNACSGPDCPSPRALELLLTGTPQPTALSGKASVPVVLGDEMATNRALYGISSRERDDNPCQVTLRSENLNDPLTKPSESKTLCGEDKQPTSSILSIGFDDGGPLGKRGFMTGIQVCMDRQDDRVKGFAIIGHAINSVGDLTPVPVPMPAEVRTNCNKDHWKRMALCPEGHLATAAELHFEHEDNEKRARSLTGVRLLCRRLVKTGGPGPLP
jgi:hypothetical protein